MGRAANARSDQDEHEQESQVPKPSKLLQKFGHQASKQDKLSCSGDWLLSWRSGAEEQHTTSVFVAQWD